MTKQVEASMSARRAKVYTKIRAVFDDLPTRFTPKELYERAGLDRSAVGPGRFLIASVLAQDFKCVSVVAQPRRYWKKPEVA